MNKISFRKLSKDDFEKIHLWLNKSHMKFYSQEKISLNKVEKKYNKRVEWKEKCYVYVSCFSKKDFWLLQYYRNRDFPNYAEEIRVQEGISIDLFIWEEDFLWKWFWKSMLEAFVKKIFNDNYDIEKIYICHEMENIPAIKCSLSVWFKYLRDIIEDKKKSKLFIITRSNINV